MGQRDLRFIRDRDLRARLKSDLSEIDQLLGAGGSLGVVVLVGSVLESILLDQLLPLAGKGHVLTSVKPRPGSTPKHLTRSWLLRSAKLSQMLLEVREHRLLPAAVLDIAKGLNGWRNHIHVAASRRTSIERPTASDAKTLAGNLDQVIERCSERRANAPTSEKVVAKFKSDPAAKAVLHRMLESLDEVELEMFLREDFLPAARWKECEADAGLRMQVHRIYDAGFRLASEATRQTVMSDYVGLLESGDATLLRSWESLFISGAHLESARPADRSVIGDHLLGQLFESWVEGDVRVRWLSGMPENLRVGQLAEWGRLAGVVLASQAGRGRVRTEVVKEVQRVITVLEGPKLARIRQGLERAQQRNERLTGASAEGIRAALELRGWPRT